MWLYLEPIFASDDIALRPCARGAPPPPSRVDSDWMEGLKTPDWMEGLNTPTVFCLPAFCLPKPPPPGSSKRDPPVRPCHRFGVSQGKARWWSEIWKSAVLLSPSCPLGFVWCEGGRRLLSCGVVFPMPHPGVAILLRSSSLPPGTRHQLPALARKFAKVNGTWRRIMALTGSHRFRRLDCTELSRCIHPHTLYFYRNSGNHTLARRQGGLTTSDCRAHPTLLFIVLPNETCHAPADACFPPFLIPSLPLRSAPRARSCGSAAPKDFHPLCDHVRSIL